MTALAAVLALLIVAACACVWWVERRLRVVRASEERLALALRASNDGAWDWNVRTGEAHYSPRWWEMLGYAPGELAADAQLWRRLMHPEDAARVLAVADEAARQGRSHYEVEVRFRHKDGHEVPVLARVFMRHDDSGRVVRVSGINTDLTERKRFERSLRESEERFRSLTALSSDWFWEQDAQFRFTRIEGNLGRLQEAAEASLGKTRWETAPGPRGDADWAAHRALLERHEPFRQLEIERTGPDGAPVWLAVSGTPVFDADGGFRGYRGVSRDITAQKLAQEEIRRLAFHDVLTGLPNRRLLVDRLQQAIAASARSRRHGALLYIDLDRFKELNDQHGHEAGDRLLKQVAQRLSAGVRAMDTVARLGGDEFVVVLEELDGDAGRARLQATRIGDHVLALLNQPYLLGDHSHRSSPSLGAALFCGASLTIDDLLQRADLAMYEAKTAGRNRLRFFEPATAQAA